MIGSINDGWRCCIATILAFLGNPAVFSSVNEAVPGEESFSFPRLRGMFNLSGSEIVLILLLALVVLGPEKLPDAIRRFGRLYGELKRMSSGFQTEFRSAFDEPLRELRETAQLTREAVHQATSTADDVSPAVPTLDSDTAASARPGGVSDSAPESPPPSAGSDPANDADAR